ncbi:hypothetical protein RUM44_000949 [Polyplax serrata]|uniref:ISXO2-like transposase domain-containing protein n=1 Tax=Polyplax serrata TaxID=468196 RepID=A0ABR1B6G0_POLSC
MLLEELSNLVKTEKVAIEFALNWKLLPEKHVICPVCSVGNVNWYRRSNEGLKIPYALRCSKKKCRKKWSLTKNTWFFGSHLTVRKNLLLIYQWIKGDTVGETSGNLKLSKSTVLDYYQFCREVCYTIVSHRTRPIGGYGEAISICNYQVDKVIDKHKRVVNYLEGFNPSTEECFLVEVHSREPSTLVYLIKRFVLPGTTVSFDGFSDFQKIANYQNDFADLHIQFMKPLTESHKPATPKISLLRSGKKFGEYEPEGKARDYVMFEYLYFHPIETLTPGEKFEWFLKDVAKVYPGPFKMSLYPVMY